MCKSMSHFVGVLMSSGHPKLVVLISTSVLKSYYNIDK